MFLLQTKALELLYNRDTVLWQTVPATCGAAGLLFMFNHFDQVFKQFDIKLLVDVTGNELMDSETLLRPLFFIDVRGYVSYPRKKVVVDVPQ